MTPSLDDMYREIILDHYRAPRGKKPLSHADITTRGQNPSCGDDISLDVEMDHGMVKDVHVNCHGCAISVASGSMLAETVKGRSFEDVKRISEIVRKMLKGEEVEVPEDLGDIDALKGVRQFPVRIKCALLAWVTLIEGMKSYEDGKHEVSNITITTEDDHEKT